VAEDATSTTLSVLSVAAPAVVGILLVLLGTWVLYYFFLRTPDEKD
jgi:cytochrome bd-type quinol oxidase subunit 2